MAATAQKTGTRDVTYNLVSVAYHALQGVETYGIYIQDARDANDSELADFFSRSQEQNRSIADEAKRLLLEKLQQAGSSG